MKKFDLQDVNLIRTEVRKKLLNRTLLPQSAAVILNDMYSVARLELDKQKLKLEQLKFLHQIGESEQLQNGVRQLERGESK